MIRPDNYYAWYRMADVTWAAQHQRNCDIDQRLGVVGGAVEERLEDKRKTSSPDDSTGPASHEKEEVEATYSLLGHFFWSGGPLAEGGFFGVIFASRESSASDTNEKEMVAAVMAEAEAEAEAAQQRTNREIGHRFDRIFDSIDELDSIEKRPDSIDNTDERLDSLEKATRITQEGLLDLAERVRDAEDRLDAMHKPQVAADSGLSGWFKSMMWKSPTG
ncbi:hypothetical protein HYALB_00003253 [Hymenoscyphus albidus]|uniref:Uncharacterized protein n=1 Tax=Hymenoscyphus albidus TaxID=595503 RepID=A0A9N9LGI9_9HELO|nr:hypothetical protein HYALB_00003253 [Hymenoscyphus albidus]